MLNKKEMIELMRYPVYKVNLRLLYYPYTASNNVTIIGGERVSTRKPSIHQSLFNYIHTQESINKEIFDSGHAEYYLQIKDDEVHEVSMDIINGLGSIVDMDITPIFLGLKQDGLYKVSTNNSDPVKNELDLWFLKKMGYVE